MKSTFFEYYPTDNEKIKTIWNSAIFCYDANVLLNIYRYTKDTRDNIFQSIEQFKDRTILPYQACSEYLKNKREVETNLSESYDKIVEVITKLISSFESGELNGYRKHCAIEIDKDVIKPIKAASDRVISKINSAKEEHNTVLNCAEIHDRITNIFDGKISNQFTDEDLKNIYSEGKNRYEKEIPPGFADYKNKKNESENSLYGDLIIWKHLIETSKSKEKDIIFVTDDRKRDWWDIYKGRTKGVLPELYREFYTLSGKNILIYSVKDFMKYAPQYSEAKAAPKKVMTEIETLRKVDISRINHSLATVSELMEKINTQSSIWGNLSQQQKLFKALDTSKLHEYWRANKMELERVNELMNEYNNINKRLKNSLFDFSVVETSENNDKE